MATQKTYDVVVVGAGVAGALIAYRLACGKRSVALVESGPELPSRLELVRRYALTTNRGPGAPYRWTKNQAALSPETDGNYYVFSDGRATFKSTYERVVGGSTWHWLGNVPRFVPSDFRLRSIYGVGRDWPIGYDDLEPWYCDAERELGVSGNHDEWDGLLGAKRSAPFPMQEVWPSYGDLVVKKAAEGLVVDGIPVRISTTPQARNSRPYDDRPACAGNSSCVPLCPIGAKYDGSVHVKKAAAAGADLFIGHVVRDIEADKQSGAVRRVIAHAADGSRLDINAKVVVVAGHAIETARLLLFNGLATSSDQVGRNLMDHLNNFGAVETTLPVFPFRGPPTTSGIDTFRDGAFRQRRAAFRMSLGNDGWGRFQAPEVLVQDLVNSGTFGRALREKVRDTSSRWLRISSSVEVLPRETNRVELDPEKRDSLGVGFPKISFALDEYTRAGLEAAFSIMEKVFEAVGYRAKPERPIDPTKYSGAGHIIGTTRMGASAQDSVVDSDCRTHDHRNLFVVGSSIFPTSGTANPTLTVAALALRAAATIERELAPANVV